MRARPPLALHVARGRAGRHADSHVGPRRRCCRRARRVGWLEEGDVILIRHVKGEPDRGLACDRRRGYPTHEGSCTPQPSSYPRSARAVSASAHTSAATATPISSGSPPRSRGRVALWCTTLYADYWATHYHFLSPLLPLLNPLWWQARCERQAFTSLALPAVAQVHDPRQPVDVHDESGRTAALGCTSRTGGEAETQAGRELHVEPHVPFPLVPTLAMKSAASLFPAASLLARLSHRQNTRATSAVAAAAPLTATHPPRVTARELTRAVLPRRTVNVACVSVSRPSVHSAPPLASPPRAAAQAAANSTSAIGKAR